MFNVPWRELNERQKLQAVGDKGESHSLHQEKKESFCDAVM